MKCVIRHVIIAALLALAFAAPASAQYMYMDTNGDGVWSGADDRLNANGTPTTVNVYLNTNHNRDGSSLFELRDVTLAHGTSTRQPRPPNERLVQQFRKSQPAFQIVCVATAFDFHHSTRCRAARRIPPVKRVQLMFTGHGAVQTERLALVPSSRNRSPTSRRSHPCSGSDFDNTYRSDLLVRNAARARARRNANPIIRPPN